MELTGSALVLVSLTVGFQRIRRGCDWCNWRDLTLSLLVLFKRNGLGGLKCSLLLL